MDVDEAILFDQAIDNALANMAELGRSEFGMIDEPRICMMAIVCQIAMDTDAPNAMDLDMVRELCAKHVRYTKTTKKCLKYGYRSFYNSVTLVFGTKAVKVFSNGKLHITGCKTVSHAHECVRAFLKMMLGHIVDDNIIESIDFSTKILNINCCIKPRKLGTAISLEKLQQKLESLAPAAPTATTTSASEARIASTRYNPDIYQALVAKMRCDDKATKLVSALIFYTGTVILTGARHATDLERSFRLVCRQMTDEGIEI
jgi:TATA-box binding protein (TBP) (component of TFIID and TFIIIB)